MKVNLIPMVGKGMRFVQEGYTTPKPLIEVSGAPMIVQAIKSLPEADKWVFVCRHEHLVQSSLGESLKACVPGVTIIHVDYDTQGQADTCLLAESRINPEDNLMIGACDNGMTWDRKKFEAHINDPTIDALIFTFRNNATVKRNPRMYGWAKVNKDNWVGKMSVKVPISNDPVNDHAVVGAFWFRRAGNFFEHVKKMIERNDRINGEFYVDKVFDLFIEAGQNVKVFEVDQYICWGTPTDLKTYQYWEQYFKGQS